MYDFCIKNVEDNYKISKNIFVSRRENETRVKKQVNLEKIR